MERDVYLRNVELNKAFSLWIDACIQAGVSFPLESEEVKVSDSLSRVTADEIFAKMSSPPFVSSAMDGIAVKSDMTKGASESNPIRLKVGRDAVFVDTGDPIPAGFDAVVMIEDLSRVGEDILEIIKPVYPWENIRPVGEDIVQTELVLPAFHVIRPPDIGALLNAGYATVRVVRKPVVSIIPTGTELVDDPADADDEKVVESNSRVLSSMVSSWGGSPIRFDLIPDDERVIESSFIKALENSDMVIINGGTSAGSEDFTAEIISRYGSIIVHGVGMRPGKPVVLGVCGRVPVVGLPGFPLANFRAAEQFVIPVVRNFLGLGSPSARKVEAFLARKVFSSIGFEEFVQVKIGKVGQRIIALPLKRGSGVLMSLVRSDGVLRIPAGIEGYEKGRKVTVDIYEPDFDIDGNILTVGSHDVSIDILASFLSRKNPRLRLASVNVGSIAGLLAVKNREGHIAGVHLIDPETGKYNLSYVRRYLHGEKYAVFRFASRTQGLIVKKGNPKNIKSIEDLTRSDLLFVNRQKGSGTRILFDLLIGSRGIDPSLVSGYESEVPTHTMVAAAVARGSADAGLGILAAARSLGCDFVPISEEKFDLVTLKDFAEGESFSAIIEVLKDPEFRKRVESLGGYDLSEAGELVLTE